MLGHVVQAERSSRLSDAYPRFDAGQRASERRDAARELAEREKELRLLATRLVVAEDNERRRIAVLLHDGVVQQLAVLRGRLDQHPRAASAGLSRHPKELCEFVDQIICEIRELNFRLASPVLCELGLAAAIQCLCERLERTSGIRCRFAAEPEPAPLPHALRAILYRAVRELLVNVEKHARASVVTVRVRREDARIRIVVADDGVGFDPEHVGRQLTADGGFGLFSIREAMEQVGGGIRISSRAGRGTRVHLAASVPAASGPASSP
jgi:signal transduction histidine kinase